MARRPGGNQQQSEYRLAMECARQARHARALHHFDNALADASRMGDFEAEGRVCRNVAVLYCDMHDPKKAMPFIERGLAAARATGNLISEGKGLLSMGVAMQQQGHMEKARQCFQQAMDIAIKEENPKLEGIAAENLAQLLTLVGKFKSSINLHEKAIMLAESQGDNAGYAVAQGQLEVTLRQREQFLVALEYASRKR
eukprot:GILI01024819.1.p1 GENE.GILI01024819.1~~GILI01024819.1.p1  ORF type:complete len:198 (-),score=44.84 GILI01024819.1:129-722(-)